MPSVYVVILNEVTARQVKITVKAPEGKVPMISEIGVFKATDSMKKANPIPSGMDLSDASERVFRSKRFCI